MQALSIHGHFYQPPREDPITGEIPQERGAAPYPNWNARIAAECYIPNAELGNFERISFNVGPTLFSWLEKEHPQTYSQILEQNRANAARYGVGNAMAQPYNHSILPLLSYQDKVTQVTWGIADFEARFGSKPTGMWLPETAVDTETLSVMHDQGIRYTILAPWQADTDNLDPTEPYRVILPNGGTMIAFFYHGDLSAGLSFRAEMTANADRFVSNYIKPTFNPEKTQKQIPQILTLATDGELYGHHQRFRDKFLAHLVNGASSNHEVTTLYPALWLRRHSVKRTMTIRENTSWSCHHGVERWRSDCACAPDGSWKAPLKHAMDTLGEQIDAVYMEEVSDEIADPLKLRNEMGHVLAGVRDLDDLIHTHAGRKLSKEKTQHIAQLLQSQYERQRMHTSCGWFFEDLDRIEPRNNIAYAAQAVALVEQGAGAKLQQHAAKLFAQSKSPVTGVPGDVMFGEHFKRLSIPELEK
jgi:alpha-amylase/alpha-mannosidase (GH57 family)